MGAFTPDEILQLLICTRPEEVDRNKNKGLQNHRRVIFRGEFLKRSLQLSLVYHAGSPGSNRRGVDLFIE